MCTWVNGRVDEIVAKYRHEDNSRRKIMLCVWMLAPSICCPVRLVIRHELRLVMGLGNTSNRFEFVLCIRRQIRIASNMIRSLKFFCKS